MSYVDGFILPVPKHRLEDYRRLAQLAGKVWLEYGAQEYVECVADDVPEGKVTSFQKAVQLEEGETVIFAWIRYASREQRDTINEKVMQDSRLKDMDMNAVPFDGRRMFWGGFEEIVRLP